MNDHVYPGVEAAKTYMDDYKRYEDGNEFTVLDEDEFVEGGVGRQTGQLLRGLFIQMLT